MKLAKEINGKIKIKNYKSIPELGIMCIGDDVDLSILKNAGYYPVKEVDYDSDLETLGEPKIVGNEVTYEKTSKGLDLATVKAEKIAEIKQSYEDEIDRLVRVAHQKTVFKKNYVIPKEVTDEYDILVAECTAKEDEINAKLTIKEVLNA